MFQKRQNNQVQKGLLALAPFFLLSVSLHAGFSFGLTIALLFVFFLPIIYFLRSLIPKQQQLPFIIIINISWILIIRMFIDAEAYSVSSRIGLFLPLMLMNSWCLSVSESMLSISSFKLVMRDIFSVGVAILLFFTIFGFLQTFLKEVSILASPAGCLFLLGFLFAGINFFNKKDLNIE